MAREITIQAGPVIAAAVLTDNTTADAIWDALPLEGVVKRWGEEIYFDIPVSIELSADARQVMEIGELAFWTGGTSFCIFFGRTPVSQADEPRAYTDVNPFGRVLGNATVFSKVQDGETIKIQPA